MIGLLEERRPSIIGDADRQGAPFFRFAQTGERERRRTARRHRDGHIRTPDLITPNELDCLLVLVFGAFDSAQ